MHYFAPEYLLALASDPVVWAALAALIAMEVVLGIDNLIFISIVTNRLPVEQRRVARQIGIALALILRLGLLGTVVFIAQLTAPLFGVFGRSFSWRDLILIAGGLFLLWKATKEIHHRVDPDHAPDFFDGVAGVATFGAVIGQIIVLDMVFSIDSVITAVGMTDYISVMVAANVIALIVMLLLGKGISAFVERHPSVKVLALSFLLMIGLVLVAEGFGAHIPKGYIYGAMGFSVFVEMINIRTTRKTKIIALNQIPHVNDIPQ